jgi:flagellar protein FlaJ
MGASLDVYVSTAFFYSTIVGAAALVPGLIISRLLHAPVLLSIALMLLLAADLGILTYNLFIYYPFLLARHMTYRIELALPHAVSFMHALSRSGASVTEIFKELSTRDDLGEIAGEARMFMRDVEYLGYDPLTALRNLARSTASEKFRTFLEVLASIIETGGDKTGYFGSKCLEYQNEAKAEQRKLIDTLGFLSEIYIIGIVFAPLMLLLLLALLGALGGFPGMLLYLVAYLGIPIGSIAFMVLVSTTVRGRGRVSMKLPKPKPQEVYTKVTIMPGSKVEEKLIGRILKGTIRLRLKAALTHPLKIVWRAPTRIFIFTGPAAVIFMLFSRSLSTSTLFFAMLIALVPYVIIYELKLRRISRIEDALVDFLRSLNSGIKSGLTLPRALSVASTSELGPLTTEVRRMGKEIEWGRSATESLSRFERRMSDSSEVARAVALIRKASEAHTDISDVLEILTNNVATSRALLKERIGAFRIYQITIFLIFFVFLFTVYTVVRNVLMLVTPTAGGAPMFGGVDVEMFKMIAFHATMFEGFFSGLVVAQMSEGELRSGLKYSIFMMAVAFVVFSKLIA